MVLSLPRSPIPGAQVLLDTALKRPAAPLTLDTGRRAYLAATRWTRQAAMDEGSNCLDPEVKGPVSRSPLQGDDACPFPLF
jgi:hypothetical protein